MHISNRCQGLQSWAARKILNCSGVEFLVNFKYIYIPEHSLMDKAPVPRKIICLPTTSQRYLLIYFSGPFCSSSQSGASLAISLFAIYVQVCFCPGATNVPFEARVGKFLSPVRTEKTGAWNWQLEVQPKFLVCRAWAGSKTQTS